jgi:non-reducing end alpha-L-arabinofuranosidase
VAAYSMVRAIYKNYRGPVYQVRSKANTSSTKDVPLLEAGGIADSKVQDDFCATDGCTVSKIYDQSPKGNHLALTPDVYWLTLTGTTRAGGGGRQKEADVKNNPKITVSGKPVYGLKFMGGQGNAYRVLKPTGTAVADEPEYMYSVFDTTVYNGSCCNDFGNAETTGNPDSFASMEAIYYGNATMWGKGGGNGPWFSCDYEAVISPGKSGTDTSIPSISIKKFATFIIKGFSGGTISLKFGDAEKGPLTTQYEGARVNGTKTMKKQGSIILGTGGDGSFYSTGVWFEGAMTAGCSSDKAVDDAIQANIVAAKFVAP